MEKSINKSKIFMIVCICVLCISLIGGTVAYYVRELFTVENQETITYGLDYYINYAKGQDIEDVTLNSSWSYEGSPSSDIELWKKDNTYDIYGHIYLDINSMSDALSDSGALKYVLLNDNEVISEGVITNKDSTMLLKANIPLETNKQLYTVHVWLDDSENPTSGLNNANLSLSVRCEATMKRIAAGNAAIYITDLYMSNKNKVVTNNNIEYQYSESVNLMNDRLGGTTEDYDAGNIRYYGANPNNYIDIGDRDSDGKVIPYRIIGVFKDIETSDGTKKDLIKVIRADSIGSYSWDNKTNGIGSSVSDYGSNDWTDSRLMMLLNPGYDKYSATNPFKDVSGDIIYGYEGSLWWNSKSGTCYFGNINGTKSCDFTSTGLSSNVQNKIETVVWNLGGNSTDNIYSDVMYTAERGTTVYKDTSTGLERSTEWEGKVALMYPSDYGYATDFNSCTSSLYYYNSSTNSYACRTNDWLYITNAVQRQLTPRSSNSYYVFNVYSAGGITCANSVYVGMVVRPVFYLNSELVIESGEGTSSDPYVIG